MQADRNSNTTSNLTYNIPGEDVPMNIGNASDQTLNSTESGYPIENVTATAGASNSSLIAQERADLTFYEFSNPIVPLANEGAITDDVDAEKMQQFETLMNATSSFQQYDNLVRVCV